MNLINKSLDSYNPIVAVISKYDICNPISCIGSNDRNVDCNGALELDNCTV